MEKSGEPWLGMEAPSNNDFKWIDGAFSCMEYRRTKQLCSGELCLHVITGILTIPKSPKKELHCFQVIMMKPVLVRSFSLKTKKERVLF